MADKKQPDGIPSYWRYSGKIHVAFMSGHMLCGATISDDKYKTGIEVEAQRVTCEECVASVKGIKDIPKGYLSKQAVEYEATTST